MTNSTLVVSDVEITILHDAEAASPFSPAR